MTVGEYTKATNRLTEQFFASKITQSTYMKRHAALKRKLEQSLQEQTHENRSVDAAGT